MRVVDCHVHLYPPDVNRDPVGWAAAHDEVKWAGLCTRRRKDGRPVQAFPSVDELLREMDRADVERGVLLGWYWDNAGTCAVQNRFYADCVRRHPDRLAAFATLQPRAGRDVTLAELRRARDDGFVGLGELSPHSQSYGIDNPAFREALAQAAEWRWPVTLHVTDPNSRDYPGRIETPLGDFLPLARAEPHLIFVLAHWGGLLPLREAEAVKLENVFYDTSASPLLYDAGVWPRFLAAVPPERILFGSDYPLNLYPKLKAGPDMTRFIAEATGAGAPEAVLGENAKRLLGR